MRGDREIDKELRFHIAERVDDLVRSGVSQDEAERRTRIEFGGLLQTREATRDQSRWRFLDNVARDLRYAARSLRHSPSFSVATIAVVALGIAASTAMFALVNAWLLRPLPLERPTELVSVWRTAAVNPRAPAYFDLYRDYLVWMAENRTLSGLAATFEQEYALTGAGYPRRVHGAIATWNLFAVIGGTATAGRLFEAGDLHGEPSCVISYSLWQSQFGAAPDTIGRVVELNDKAYRVLGVLPAGFSLRVLDRPFEPDVWTVILADDTGHTAASLSPVSVIGRLKSGVSVAQADADLGAIQAVLNRRYSDEPAGSGVLVTGLQQDNTRTVRTSLLLLMAAVAVLLVIACVNAAGLILGRHVHRARELAVRLALGCSVTRLLQQLTVEVLLLFACGGALGLAMASVLIHLFVALNPLGVLPPGGISIDGTVLATAGSAIGDRVAVRVGAGDTRAAATGRRRAAFPPGDTRSQSRPIANVFCRVRDRAIGGSVGERGSAHLIVREDCRPAARVRHAQRVCH
jgi:predicted permease